MRLLLCLILLLSAGAARACDGRLIEGPDLFGGPLCLPAEPRRIAVLDPALSLGMAMELDLPVVAAPMTGMSDEALRSEAAEKGVVDLGFVWQPSVEALVAAKPDLIIGSSLSAEVQFPLLSRIAPTALITTSDWRDFYRSFARLTGRENRLAALFAPLDARIADLRERVPDTTVSVLRITPWDFQVYLDGPAAWAPFAILRETGVRRSVYETTEDATSVKRPDWEELGQLDGAILLTIIGGMNDSATSGRWEEVVSNPLWQMLPAVRAGRVHPISPAVWMEFSGIRAANRVLDDVERLVIGTP